MSKKLLGKQLKDRASGFSGTCTAVMTRLNHEDICEITAKSYGSRPEQIWYSLKAVEIIKPEKKKPVKKKAKVVIRDRVPAKKKSSKKNKTPNSL